MGSAPLNAAVRYIQHNLPGSSRIVPALRIKFVHTVPSAHLINAFTHNTEYNPGSRIPSTLFPWVVTVAAAAIRINLVTLTGRAGSAGQSSCCRKLARETDKRQATMDETTTAERLNTRFMS